MNAYIEYMVRQIAEEIKSITDPYILAIYLRAISMQRCAIGGSKANTCKECIYQCYNCRELYNISKDELEAFDEDESEEK